MARTELTRRVLVDAGFQVTTHSHGMTGTRDRFGRDPLLCFFISQTAGCQSYWELRAGPKVAVLLDGFGLASLVSALRDMALLTPSVSPDAYPYCPAAEAIAADLVPAAAD